jgi:hypothetical protein
MHVHCAGIWYGWRSWSVAGRDAFEKPGLLLPLLQLLLPARGLTPSLP